MSEASETSIEEGNEGNRVIERYQCNKDFIEINKTWTDQNPIIKPEKKKSFSQEIFRLR